MTKYRKGRQAIKDAVRGIQYPPTYNGRPTVTRTFERHSRITPPSKGVPIDGFVPMEIIEDGWTYDRWAGYLIDDEEHSSEGKRR
jgi:hypothetical protein